jgi:opacity protein-like surface antigen
MKLTEINKSARLTGIFLALASLGAHAGGVEVETVTAAPIGNAYVSFFGGGGSSTKTNMSLYGTALFSEDLGGPLAVDAFGNTNSRSVGMIGGHVGFQWEDVLTDAWTITPAIEAEGFYLSRSDFEGHEINNDTDRLPEHDFDVTYPTSANVFLMNAVLNLNLNTWFRPYVSAGLGGALVSISGATSIQVAPPEVGVNHFNARTSDKDSVFASQVKVGATFAISQHFDVFAEYRWLYLAASHYTFGSTVYPGHAVTTAWQLDLRSQNYNMGAAGIRYIF